MALMFLTVYEFKTA